MGTAPKIWAGVTAVILVALMTLSDVTGPPPTLTAVAPVKFVPVRAIAVPPAVVPVFGETDVIVGGGTL
jgi:hypothetical protein